MPSAETSCAMRLPTIWTISDDLWEKIEPILSRHYPPAATGRPRADLRKVLDGLIYRLRTGAQWDQMPERFGAPSTVHGWFQRFTDDGVLREIWAELARECERLGGVDWRWQSADGVMGKSRFCGDARGPNPTDRAKSGTKKSLLVEGGGRPLGVVIDGANRSDTKLLAKTIEAIVIERPDPERFVQHLCLDKGYDNPTGREACLEAGYWPHIRLIRDPLPQLANGETEPARRWVVERAIGWLQKCRGLLIRYEKKAENYLGLIELACALLWARRLHGLRGAD